MKTIQIFDTTLRDGEQSPGAAMTAEEKVRIATQLARSGVNVIEAGFPAISRDDLKAVADVAAAVQGTGVTVTALARASRSDIDTAAEALQGAERARIHVFIATSDIHMRNKLKMSRDEVKIRVAEHVAYAASKGAEVEFSGEDATRSDPDFLVEVYRIAYDNGARILNVPDTVGYTHPWEYEERIRKVVNALPDDAIVSAHCHDDLGMATVNSLAAIRGGARQIECTVNGIGERAGNASLEEIVAAIAVREDFFGVRTTVDIAAMPGISATVSAVTGFSVAPNKAVVGRNAHAHASGIHQDGVLKDPETYSIFAKIAGVQQPEIVMARHSGRHAFRAKLEAMGRKISEPEVDGMFARFKAWSAGRRIVEDEDFREWAAMASPGRM